MIKMKRWAISLALSAAVLAAVPNLATASGAPKEAGISIYYGVKAGDTLYGISKRHYLTGNYERVAKLNGIDAQSGLKAGSRIKLNNPLVLDHYSVKQGDTVVSIAAKYFNRSNYISLMMQYNGMTSTADLKAGMELKIPTPSGEKVHRVKAGETLFGISGKYYKPEDYQTAIAKSNGLKGAASALKLGQSVQIPNPFYAG